MGFHPSACPYCSCGCGLLLHVEDNRLVGSHPISDHPVAKGSLCIRGWNCAQAPYDETRLSTARVRRDGRLVDVSADAAIEEIAVRLEGIQRGPSVARHGPGRAGGTRAALLAVGPGVANEDVVAARRLAELLDADVCGTEIAGPRVARSALQAVLGKGYSARTLDVLAEADVIWLFGLDAENYPQIASRLVHARRRGAALVQFDIRASSSRPGMRAVTIPPGTSAVLPVLLQKAAFDLGAVPPRFASVPQLSSLARPFVPGRGPLLPEHGWLPDELAQELVRAFLGARNTAVVVGDRWLGSVHGEQQTIQLLQALVLLGAEERVVMATGEANSWGSVDLLPQMPDTASPLVNLLDPGNHGSLRTLFIVGDDLLRRTPRPGALAQKLPAIETIVVIDRFETDCLPFAHVVLPSALFAELDGSVTNALGMVQRWHRVLAAPGDARPEREWFHAVGRRLGATGWPADAREWLRAAGSVNTSYSSRSLDALHGDRPPITVSLEERGRITLIEPFVPAAAPRDGAYPLHLHFRSHPAFWSTGVLSEREQLLKREATESSVSLSPGDLQRAGLRDGSAARVVTPCGEAVLTVRVDPSLPDNVSVVVAVPRGDSAVRLDVANTAVAADGRQMRADAGVGALRGFHPDADGRTVGTEPVPGRVEHV